MDGTTCALSQPTTIFPSPCCGRGLWCVVVGRSAGAAEGGQIRDDHVGECGSVVLDPPQVPLLHRRVGLRAELPGAAGAVDLPEPAACRVDRAGGGLVTGGSA